MIPYVPLAEIVNPVERPEAPVPGVLYRQIGVRLWGEGAYERETIDGGDTKYKTFSRMAENDIVVNKIWARNGSVALVSKALAGTYGSGEFPTFAPDKNYLEPRRFHWLTKTKWFWDQCDLKSRGTSGKNRIRPEKFLQIEIPLPPLPEQRRIVAKIEALAGKIEEARGLRAKSVDLSESLLKIFSKTFFKDDNNKTMVLPGFPWVAMKNPQGLCRRSREILAAETLTSPRPSLHSMPRVDVKVSLTALRDLDIYSLGMLA